MACQNLPLEPGRPVIDCLLSIFNRRAWVALARTGATSTVEIRATGNLAIQCRQFTRSNRAGSSAAARAAAVLLLGLLVTDLGCAPYRFGSRSLYSADIQTVYVPVFSSNSFRPDLGERLTEAVIKEIEKRTPYKVVNTPDADSVLSGQVVRDAKRNTILSPTHESREFETALAVRVSWVDRNNATLQQGNVPIPTAAIELLQAADVRPEIGGTVATGQQETIQRLAKQIVSMMEAPW